MSYFAPGGTPLTCQGAISSPVVDGDRRCVMANGHYLEDGPGGRSWHTDCVNARGKDRAPEDDNEHSHERPCGVWADHADGAFYLDRPATRAEAQSMDKVSEPRAVTDLGDYVASLDIGGARLHVHGPARLVAYVVRAMADAFEEEAER